jgi:hypothetical protein
VVVTGSRVRSRFVGPVHMASTERSGHHRASTPWRDQREVRFPALLPLHGRSSHGVLWLSNRVVCRLSSVVCRLSSVVCRLSSVVCRLSSVVCRVSCVVVASWIVQGLIDYVTGPSLDAKILRDNFVFKVIPMLNPDGVIVGNYRCSLAGCDLNRCWQNPDKRLHPTIFHAKQVCDSPTESP